MSIFYSLLFISGLLFSQNSTAADSLSYSGRLVKADGSPVAGPVDLTIDLAYTNTPATILCSQNFPAVVLSNGVFHLKLDLVCPGPPVKTLTEILTAVPATFAAALRVTDVTNNKIYSFQALHAMPFSSISETAKQLVQLGAVNGQVLKWNDTTKKWEPGTPGGGGTVTNLTATSPLAVINGATTPDLSIAKATTSTDGYLSAADWNAFNNKVGVATGGTTAQYYRGDNSWQTLNSDAVAVGVSNLYFTNALALGVPLGASLNVGLTGDISSADTILSAFGRAQKQLSSLATASSNFLIKNTTDSVTGEVSINAISGSLLLPRTPSDAELTQAANVDYVKTYADTKLPLSGGTLTNDLILNTKAKFKGGLNFVELKADATLPATISLTLPMTLGGNGDVLTSNGAGVMSWTTPASTAAPSGAAGGDLTGTYPNPTILAVAQAKVTGLAAALAAKQSTTLSSGNLLVGNVGNVATEVVISGDATLSNAGVLALKNTGSAGTYTSVTTDAQGRVTAGSNPVVVTSISATAPVIVTGTTTPVVSMAAATTAVNGYLSSSDWNTFNLKQAALSNSAGLAAALSDETGSGLAVFNSAPTILNPVIANIAPVADFTVTQNAVVPFTSVGASAVANTLYLKAGKVGIGTITPAQALDVVGNINGSQLCIAGTCKATWPTGVSTGVISDNEVSATANIAQSKISGLTTSLSGKEPAIAAGTSAQYLKGDKSWGTFASEVLATALTSLSTATNAVITASDSVLSAFGKLQAQVTNLVALDANKLSKNSADSITAVVTVSGAGDLLVPSTPAGMTSAVNKTYVDTSISNNGVWAKVGSDINYGAGNVGIGTTSPSTALDVFSETISGPALGRQISGITVFTNGMKASTVYKKLFLLPVTSVSNFAHLVISGAVGGWVSGQGKAYVNISMSTRDAENFIGTYSGNLGNCDIRVYKLADNSYEVWGVYTSAGSYTTPWSLSANGTLEINTVGNGSNAVYVGKSNAETTTAPTGTQLWSLSTNAQHVLTNSGNVGIGTTTPAYPLSIYRSTAGVTSNIESGGNGNAALNRYAGMTNGAAARVWGAGLNQSLGNGEYEVYDYTAGASRLLINTSGNIGIGTTSPNRVLQVIGAPVVTTDNRSVISARDNTALAAGTGGGIDFGGVYNLTGTQAEWAGIKSIKANAVDGEYGAHMAFMTRLHGAGTTERMRITDSGNVGIGTTAPSQLFQLTNASAGGGDQTLAQIGFGSGSLFLTHNAPYLSGNLRFDDGSWRFEGNGSGAYIGIGGDILFGNITAGTAGALAAPTQKMVITTAGNVGIGTATPSSHLHVSANAPASYTSMAIENTAAGGNKWSFLASSTGASLGANRMCLETGGICRVSIDTVGNMTIGGTLTQSSDLRLKRDFKLLPHALESLSTLKGLTYYWSDPNRSKDRQIGLIAQDVEKVFPEVVYTDAQGFKSVAYQSLVAPMIEAFKEIRNWMFGIDKKLDSHDRAIASQSDEIKKLRDEVQKSHQENEQLKKDIAEIKKSLSRK